MRFGFIAVIAFLIALPVRAHEFWLEPEDFTLQPGDTLTSHVRIGQDFKGNSFTFLPSLFTRFDFAVAGAVLPVRGRAGDRPAAQMTVTDGGLMTLIHQTTPLKLTYREAEKFQNFLRYEGLDGIKEAHIARGLPEADFSEAYTRFAKTLVAVGDGAGDDRAYGLRLELIALSNPYTDAGPVPVKLMFEGQPLIGAQINLFRRAPDGAVILENLRTDARGIVTVDAAAHQTIMLNAVKMVLPDAAMAAEMDVVWHSLWANLTFQRD